jgi:DNA-binding response OmpR family regulator
VEDHADTAELLCALLSSAGYQVRTANSVEAALACDIAAIDLVLSDVGLGDGSGLELIQQLRAKAEVPAIALSGFGTEADIRASKQAGFFTHLTKPVSFDQLLAAIESASG